MDDRINYRPLTHGSARRRAIVALVGTLGGMALGGRVALAKSEDGISHTAESIHQEPVFKASPKRVYEALTDPAQFTRVVKLSGALEAMHLPDQPAQISSDVGGAFALFGGFITGRHVELVPSVRIVQAWRAADWSPGFFSIARFELVGQGATCKIRFDHTGIPRGTAESLAAGWKTHYWEPLAKVLA